MSQMKMMQSLGPLEGLLGLLPGFSKIRKQLPEGAMDPRRMKRMEAIVLSMTPEERVNYKLLIPSRRRRIAKGSGVSEIEVNRFIKNFKEMKEMMGGKGKMGGMMKNLMKGAKGGMPDMNAMMNAQGGGGMPDMSALMGQGGMPDMSQMPDLSSLMGGGRRKAEDAQGYQRLQWFVPQTLI